MIAGGIFIGDFLLKLGIFNFLIKPIVRDIALFLLIIGILIWVVLINKKTRKPVSEEIEEIKATADDMGRFNEELREAANVIVSNNEELRNSIEKERTESEKLRVENKNMKVLMGAARTKIDEIDKAISGVRKDMKRDFEKALENLESKKQPEENKKLELIDEHVTILSRLANSIDSVGYGDLFANYKKKYEPKELKDFKFIMTDLSKYNLIHLVYSFDEQDYYEITDEGLEALREKQK